MALDSSVWSWILLNILLLENNHGTKLNHKLLNPFQITNHDFTIAPEKLLIIEAIELHWPFLRSKNVINLFATLPMHSATEAWFGLVGLGSDSMSRKCLLRKILLNFERYNIFVLGHQSAYVMNWMVKWKSWSRKSVGGGEN